MYLDQIAHRLNDFSAITLKNSSSNRDIFQVEGFVRCVSYPPVDWPIVQRWPQDIRINETSRKGQIVIAQWQGAINSGGFDAIK